VLILTDFKCTPFCLELNPCSLSLTSVRFHDLIRASFSGTVHSHVRVKFHGPNLRHLLHQQPQRTREDGVEKLTPVGPWLVKTSIF
jgi:hypothetical protein